jgi:hypothetical protein
MAEEEGTTEGAVEGAESTTEKPELKQGDGIPAEVKAALRKANKEAETLRLKLKEIEDRDKSELEKAQERAAEAEKVAAGHESTALRLQVAFDKGLTPAQAKRLVGSSREELETDADEILRDFVAPASRPRGSVDQGHRGTAAKADPRQAFADLLGGKS